MEKILRVHSVNDYARYIGAPVLHPLRVRQEVRKGLHLVHKLLRFLYFVHKALTYLTSHQIEVQMIAQKLQRSLHRRAYHFSSS